MTQRKLRILFTGESSFLKTGYSIYTHEVLTRLYATNKYEIAEFGIYGHMNDDRRMELPWRYYGNAPDTPDYEATYNANNRNQFGQWKFEEICLDFKPDVVIDIRDVFMMSYAERSPFRAFYEWAIMPAIDSIPQQDEWLATYMDADAVFAYSEFGRDYLKEICGDFINFKDLASPAANYDILKPVADKHAHRAAFGFDSNVRIIGTVMRNQRRKLYPDLIESFAKFCKLYPDISKNTYLYIHTSYPDHGWEIPTLIRKAGVGNKVLFTYICVNPACSHVFPSFFQDAIQACPKCGKPTGCLPNIQTGVTTEQMGNILNFFDLYVQYASAEGFGMPIVEAAACGVPIMAIDYSAMSSVIKNLSKGGMAIPVKAYITVSETLQKRAVPDNDAFIEMLKNFLLKPESVKMRMGREAYQNAKKHYSWDKAAKAWETYLDQVGIKPEQETWTSPANIITPNLNVPDGLNNEQFVRWGIINIWGRPDKINGYLALRMIRDLNYQKSVGGVSDSYYHSDDSIFGRPTFKQFTRNDAAQALLKLHGIQQHWEQRRTGLIKETPSPFIINAKPEIS